MHSSNRLTWWIFFASGLVIVSGGNPKYALINIKLYSKVDVRHPAFGYIIKSNKKVDGENY